MSRLDETCSLCGSSMTLYFYPRPGPAPGNMIVCSNQNCEASETGIRKKMQERIRETARHFKNNT